MIHGRQGLGAPVAEGDRITLKPELKGQRAARAPPVERVTLRSSIDGARLDTRIIGNPDARQAIVFQHALALNKLDWWRQFDLARRLPDYKLIFVDSRGHGESDTGGREWESDEDLPLIEREAHDLVDLLIAQHVERVIIVSHSIGGLRASALLQNNPLALEHAGAATRAGT